MNHTKMYEPLSDSQNAILTALYDGAAGNNDELVCCNSEEDDENMDLANVPN